MEEDKLFGEKVMDIVMPYITHEVWDSLNKDKKKQLIVHELKRQNYLRTNKVSDKFCKEL